MGTYDDSQCRSALLVSGLVDTEGPNSKQWHIFIFFDMIDVLLVEKFNRALERSASLWVISKYAIRQRYAVLNQIRGLISAYLITLTNWVH